MSSVLSYASVQWKLSPQITDSDDQVEVNVGAGTISGRNDDKRLGIGTAVRARIVSLSPDTSDPRRSKIGLTCKQPGLDLLNGLAKQVSEDG